jgi:hypothetical protein
MDETGGAVCSLQPGETFEGTDAVKAPVATEAKEDDDESDLDLSDLAGALPWRTPRLITRIAARCCGWRRWISRFASR